MATPNYIIREENLSAEGVEYLFVSKGVKDVIKAVQFDYVMNFSERKVYNLGFGDYDIFSGKINDSINWCRAVIVRQSLLNAVGALV